MDNNEMKMKLKKMITNISKSSNAEYNAVMTGATAAKGSDQWIIQKMKKRVTGDHYLPWFKIMVEGNYKQKKKARKYARHILGIEQ